MRKLPYFVALLLAGCLPILSESTPATFNPATQVFRLDAANTSYAFGVNARGELQQIYWGGRLASTDAFPKARAHA